jgi:hypothetical protein
MRRTAFVALIAAGLISGSCSKTQDTAPETRLFGNPPVIQNVTLTQGGSSGQALCDITQSVKGFFCEKGGITESDVNYPPAITLTVKYSGLQLAVQTTDPDTVAGQPNDILLVSASYQKTNQGQPVEVSLVLLDDGSTNTFTYRQQSVNGEQCEPGACFCGTATYKLTSNDNVANDNTWSRGFALVTGDTTLTHPLRTNGDTLSVTNSQLAYDCIGSGPKEATGPTVITGGNQQAPAITDTGGQPVKFKIEVVDRAGNITGWPQQPIATFDKTTYSCEGDDCACCFIFSGNPTSECSGLDGMVGPTFPTGLCHTF